ncbi:MAG: bifunctional UDP-N-acetylglucosamine diphosphorylase/glucosamine-1-phosphate N-acetyltransferase GlmU [Holosporales bacterium]|jgi:bifunctional UDP-N-acetylglucosamine pyrophosphorylase/glucosamine-1-phosphate N-acetyltransferase|nr:bifunctional UDP-N-acetylglucosamine diphosphorylase/glucosamine-1-phosphate N-acetyltransferase GlmU [Holosporales bacterium]
MKTSVDFMILAGGRGTRTKCSLPKVFQELAGKPLIRYVIDTCHGVTSADPGITGRIISVVSPSIKDHELCEDSITVVQTLPNGTGDAVRTAIPLLDSEMTVILYADTPLVEPSHLLSLISNGHDVSLISCRIPDDMMEMPYGRVITDPLNHFIKIVEYRDATPGEKKCPFANSGIYKIKTDLLKRYIKDIPPNKLTNEYYLTDLLTVFVEKNIEVFAMQNERYWPFHGINTLVDLARAEEILQDKLRTKSLNSGVKLYDPKTVYFSSDTVIEKDVVIEQHVIIKNKVVIRSGAHIKAFSYLEECEIMEGTVVGPFARIRNSSTLAPRSVVGNFVEIKKSYIGESSKIKHLAYVGDATLGSNTNIGAGTITCNFDGAHKHDTIIGNNVMVGANCSLVAPIKIGNGSMVAAGSIINKDVPDEALAIARVPQQNKPDEAPRIITRKVNLTKRK